MNSWFDKDKNKVDFKIIYVREAHASDGNQSRANIRDGVLVENHKTIEEREKAAEACATDLKLKIPIIMDNMEDTTEKAYQGWPDRLYIVAKDGSSLMWVEKAPLDLIRKRHKKP